VARPSFRRNPTVSKPRPWYKRDPQRYEIEQRIVREHFGSLTIRIDPERELVLIEGRIDIESPSGATDGTVVRVTLSRNHPKGAPIAEDIEGRFPYTPIFHQYSESRTECLWFQPDSSWTDHEDALRIYLAELVVHVERQLICEADPAHQWPGPARPHTERGAYEELLREHIHDVQLSEKVIQRWTNGTFIGRNEGCLCESGRKWKRCHRDAIENLEHICGGRFKLRQVFASMLLRNTGGT
jgi:hypothetical protein